MRTCGIDLKGNEAILVLVEVDAEGSVEWIPTQTKRISLGDDHDARELLNFWGAVQAYLQEHKVDIIVVKERQRSDGMAAGAATFKMETIIQLIEGYECKFLWGANVAKFIKKESPAPPANLNVYQQDAFYTALLYQKS